MKIAFFSKREGGCYWYRTAIPLTALEEDNIEILPLEGGQKFKSDVQSVQIARHYKQNIKNGIDFCKKNGIKLVYDIDDATDLVDDSNYYSKHFNEETAKQVDSFLKQADIITTTTPKMVEYLSKKTDKPIIIYPNCLDFDEWKLRKGNQGRLRIGFSGSMSHIADIIEVLPTIKKLQDKYDFDFIIQGMGYEPYAEYFQFLYGTSNEELRGYLTQMDKMLSQIKFEWIRWVDPQVHPYLLNALNLDIGVCPLRDTEFNKHKSCVKFYEYASTGTLTIASDMLPYNEEPCYVTNNWEKTLEYFILNPDKRTQETLKQYTWVRENRNVKDFIPLLKDIYL